MSMNRVGTGLLVLGGAAVVVGLAWLGSGRLAGRAAGWGDDDCRVTTGKAPDGVLEAWARCEWDLPAADVVAILAGYGDQARHFDGVAESTILASEGGRTLVRQVQQASGISNREVVLEFVAETIPNGRRYRWRKADDQSGRDADHVECEVHEGHWQVVGTGERTTVEYHLRYLPGGRVPSFLVSAFLSAGVEDALGDLHQAAGTQQVARREAGGL